MYISIHTLTHTNILKNTISEHPSTSPCSKCGSRELILEVRGLGASIGQRSLPGMTDMPELSSCLMYEIMPPAAGHSLECLSVYM